MEGRLKSSSEEQGRGRRAAAADNKLQHSGSSHVQPPLPRPRLPGVRGCELDLVSLSIPPLPGGCSLGLGYNLGFIWQKAPAQAALCFIMPEPSVFTAQCPDASALHLLTPLHPIINTSNSQKGLFKPSKIIRKFKILISNGASL